MSPAAWGALGAAIGPLLVFLVWVLSRREAAKGADFNAMASAVKASLDTTKTMQTLLAPLEAEISQLRIEVVLLRTHVNALERQIKALGHDPIPPPSTLPDEGAGGVPV